MAIAPNEKSPTLGSTRSEDAASVSGAKLASGKVNKPKVITEVDAPFTGNGNLTSQNVETSTNTDTTPKPQVSAEELSAIYSIPLAVINSSPELKSLFDQAWAAEKAGMAWSQELFAIKLRNTDWYKTKSEAQRKYYVLANDPAQKAEFEAQVAKSKASIADSAGLLGVTLTAAQIDELAKTNLQYGLSPSELQDVLSTYITYEGKTDEEIIGSLYGNAGNYEDQIRTWAKQNGVTISNDWVINQVRGIIAGDFDTNKSKDYITGIAKQQYSAWSDKLDNATSLLDLAAGFRQTLSDEFNKPYEQIDLSDNYLKSAMTSTDDSGKPISIDALKKTVRKTNEWAEVTKNKDKVTSVANEVLSRFGMV